MGLRASPMGLLLSHWTTPWDYAAGTALPHGMAPQGTATRMELHTFGVLSHGKPRFINNAAAAVQRLGCIAAELLFHAALLHGPQFIAKLLQHLSVTKRSYASAA